MDSRCSPLPHAAARVHLPCGNQSHAQARVAKRHPEAARGAVRHWLAGTVHAREALLERGLQVDAQVRHRERLLFVRKPLRRHLVQAGNVGR